MADFEIQNGINPELVDKYLVFRVDESFALELKTIVEIVESRPVTKVPETPDYIAGVINLRGETLPVLDMRQRFKKPPREEGLRSCMIVIRFEDTKLALIADEVTDLITIAPEAVAPPPQVGNDYSHVFIQAIGIYDDSMHLILDADKLINLSELCFMLQENDQ